jgi:hypothetical protein
LDLFAELLSDPYRYGLGWLKPRFAAMPSKTKLSLVLLGEIVKEARESRLPSLV